MALLFQAAAEKSADFWQQYYAQLTPSGGPKTLNNYDQYSWHQYLANLPSPADLFTPLPAFYRDTLDNRTLTNNLTDSFFAFPTAESSTFGESQPSLHATASLTTLTTASTSPPTTTVPSTDSQTEHGGQTDRQTTEKTDKHQQESPVSSGRTPFAFDIDSMIKTESPMSAAFGIQDANVTLWQFLLELLIRGDHPDKIQWTSSEGEFKLLDAEAVARLWGARKNKPNMNYDKLSRALRYYYEKNIIKKVTGQKFVYRFVKYPDNSQGDYLAYAVGRVSVNGSVLPPLPTLSSMQCYHHPSNAATPPSLHSSNPAPSTSSDLSSANSVSSASAAQHGDASSPASSASSPLSLGSDGRNSAPAPAVLRPQPVHLPVLTSDLDSKCRKRKNSYDDGPRVIGDGSGRAEKRPSPDHYNRSASELENGSALAASSTGCLNNTTCVKTSTTTTSGVKTSNASSQPRPKPKPQPLNLTQAHRLTSQMASAPRAAVSSPHHQQQQQQQLYSQPSPLLNNYCMALCAAGLWPPAATLPLSPLLSATLPSPSMAGAFLIPPSPYATGQQQHQFNAKLQHQSQQPPPASTNFPFPQSPYSPALSAALINAAMALTSSPSFFHGNNSGSPAIRPSAFMPIPSPGGGLKTPIPTANRAD